MSITIAARKIGTFVLVALISLALAELALRLVDAVRPSYIFQDDSYNRFRVRPGSDFYGFPVNSLGFFDTEFPPPDSRTFRILALGDSFAFGVVPYKNNYLTLLQDSLDSTTRSVEVLNMGIPRTAPKDYLDLLINEGLVLDPDVVLVSLYIGNDLLETYRTLEKPPQVLLAERSYVVSLIRRAFRLQAQTEWGVVHHRRHYSDDAPTFNPSSYNQILRIRSQVFVVGWKGLGDTVDSIDSTLKRVATICHRRNIAIAVVLIPDEIQVSPTLQAEVSAASRRDHATEMDFTQPNQVLARRLAALEIPFLDLLPSFAEASRSERLYKPRDTHWNIAGNRLAAREIAGFLTNVGIVPQTKTPRGE